MINLTGQNQNRVKRDVYDNLIDNYLKITAKL